MCSLSRQKNQKTIEPVSGCQCTIYSQTPILHEQITPKHTNELTEWLCHNYWHVLQKADFLGLAHGEKKSLESVDVPGRLQRPSSGIRTTRTSRIATPWMCLDILSITHIRAPACEQSEDKYLGGLVWARCRRGKGLASDLKFERDKS